MYIVIIAEHGDRGDHIAVGPFLDKEDSERFASQTRETCGDAAVSVVPLDAPGIRFDPGYDW